MSDSSWEESARKDQTIVWFRADDWMAVTRIHESGEFSAELTFEEVVYDAYRIADPGVLTVDVLAADALDRFDAWLAEHGDLAVDDSVFHLEISKRQAKALHEGLPALLELLAQRDPSPQLLGLRHALTCIQQQVDQTGETRPG